MTDILTEYNVLLNEIVSNEWFSIPLQNYRAIENRTDTQYKSRVMKDSTIDFLSYIGVDRPSAALRQIQLLNQ